MDEYEYGHMANLYPFNKYFLTTYDIPGTVLDVRTRALNITDKSPASWRLHSIQGRQNIKLGLPTGFSRMHSVFDGEWCYGEK